MQRTLDPRANLIFDATGNLYGTTQFGGAFSGGTVFKLAPQVGSAWKESILHNFIPNSSDETEGYQPIAGLIFDQAGNVGTTLLEEPNEGQALRIRVISNWRRGLEKNHPLWFRFCGRKKLLIPECCSIAQATYMVQ